MTEENQLIDSTELTNLVITTLSDPDTYSQVAIISLIYLFAYTLAKKMRAAAPVLNKAPASVQEHPIHFFLYRVGKLLFPILAIFFLRIAFAFSQTYLQQNWLMNVALVVAMLLLFNSFVNLVITNAIAEKLFHWIGTPILFLHLVDFLDDIVRVLESISLDVGNISVSAYGLIRVLLFGSLLFWLGRISNSTGQTIIRRQTTIDFRTREVLAKLFEISLFFVIFLLLLQIMGINLTALAVFGGAVGVGLGFGLQSIASNFISGVIILLDRSVSLGDYVELEDGRTGEVTQLNMRSTTLETFDGKDIVVPNEKFITGAFTNWTHKNKKQRYRVDFSVAYSTDVRKTVELIKAAVATHEQVISGEDIPFEERPDCEIDSFGDSGINMFVEFWMEGIDDGRNRVGGDLLLIILETLQANNIEIPFPQREVRILSDKPGAN